VREDLLIGAWGRRTDLVVTMEDLWPRFAGDFDDGLVGPLFVTTLERTELDWIVDGLPACQSVVGLGGGQALDVAKYVAWRRRIPLFQVPTAMSVNAAWGQRAAVRVDGTMSLDRRDLGARYLLLLADGEIADRSARAAASRETLEAEAPAVREGSQAATEVLADFE
jgi:hypothetical protein